MIIQFEDFFLWFFKWNKHTKFKNTKHRICLRINKAHQFRILYVMLWVGECRDERRLWWWRQNNENRVQKKTMRRYMCVCMDARASQDVHVTFYWRKLNWTEYSLCIYKWLIGNREYFNLYYIAFDGQCFQP